jgi:hypothetical protein
MFCKCSHTVKTIRSGVFPREFTTFGFFFGRRADCGGDVLNKREGFKCGDG